MTLKMRLVCIAIGAIIIVSAFDSRSAVCAALSPRHFGWPPSGEVPIFYNDHHVYTKPDRLRHQRVLAAIIRQGRFFVPLRSMFEQMGAAVSYDAASKSVTATNANASVRVALGSPDVTINGRTRPLDVPPMMYKGALVVSVRVMSEALGAYVEWVPVRHIVVVRFMAPTPVPPTAPPSALPAPSPTPASTASSTSAPRARGFIQGAWILGGREYNEFADGKYCRNASYLWSAAYPLGRNWTVKVDGRQDEYVTASDASNIQGDQFTVFSTIDGGAAATPVFLSRQNTLDARLEYRVGPPGWNVGVSYLQASNRYGYPALRGLGFGGEKLPDFGSRVSAFGSAYYYPTTAGNYTVSNPISTNFNVSYRQAYAIFTYDVGIDVKFAQNSAFYVYGGFAGDRYAKRQNAPIDQTHSGPYVGLGVRI